MTVATVLTFIRRVTGWTVALAAVGVVVAAVVVPRLAGATPYAVLTGSMSPGMPPGTLVVVRPATPDDLATGDVITYQLRSGQPDVVTHRIIGVGYDGRGEPVYRTQGDASPAADRAGVRIEQVRGERWYSLPGVGHLSAILDPDQRQLLVTVIGWGLAGYAAWTVLAALQARRRRDRTAAKASGPEHLVGESR